MKLHELKRGMEVIFEDDLHGVVDFVDEAYNEVHYIGDYFSVYNHNNLTSEVSGFTIKEVLNLDDNGIYYSIWKREEKKYYLRLKAPKGFKYIEEDVLNLYTETGEFFSDSKTNTSEDKTEFTEKDLEELGFKLSDFMYCEVGSDIWVYDPYFTHHSKTEFENILNEMLSTYLEKNGMYGDSFGKSVDKYGMIAALTRISDKFNRFEQMIMNNNNGTNDESLRDTLLDMASYCVMTIVELENE